MIKTIILTLFGTDISVFNMIYRQCKIAGSAFGYGAFEGFVMYTGIITAATLKVINSNTKRVVKK
jgi:hypothetical protein